MSPDAYEITILLAGCAISATSGCLLSWLASRGQIRTFKSLLESSDAQRNEISTRSGAEINRLQERLETSQSLHASVRAHNASLETELATLRESLARRDEERQSLLEAAEERLAATFYQVSSQIFDKSRQELVSQHNQSALHQQELTREMLSPLNSALREYKAHIQHLENSRQNAYGEIRQMIAQLSQGNQLLQSETSRLVRALRTPTGRGQWGEIQLRRVVELAGMLEYCDFETQASSVNTEGERIRPDLIVKLPGGKQVIVDAKTPMDAYLRAIDATDEDIRSVELGTHARQVRAHLSTLGSKAYHRNFAGSSPEFTVMFLPSESFFQAALESDPALIDFAASQNTVIATPTTLIALLRAVAYGWSQENLAENARKIAQAGQTLHERFAIFRNHLATLSSSLGKGVESFNAAVRSLDSRLLPAAVALEKLGAKSGKSLNPEKSLDIAVRPVTLLATTEVEADPQTGALPQPDILGLFSDEPTIPQATGQGDMPQGSAANSSPTPEHEVSDVGAGKEFSAARPDNRGAISDLLTAASDASATANQPPNVRYVSGHQEQASPSGAPVWVVSSLAGISRMLEEQSRTDTPGTRAE